MPFSFVSSPLVTSRSTDRTARTYMLMSICVLCGLWSCTASRSSESSRAGQTALKIASQRVQGTPRSSGAPNAAVVEMLTPAKPPEYLKPTKARDFFVRGSTLQMQERWAESILEFQQALRYDTAAVIYFSIAQSYAKIGKNDLSQESALAAIKLDSTFLPPYKLVAESYVAQYRIEEAITMYSYIADKEPDIQNRFTVARLYELRKPEKAVEVYSGILEEMSEDDPNEQIILGRLVELQAKQGRTDLATSALERLHTKYPANLIYTRSLLEAYIWRKQFDKGFELLTAIEPELPEQEAITFSMVYGDGLVQNFDSTAQAREYAQRFLSRSESRAKSAFSSSAAYQMVCGMLALNLKQLNQSRFYFDRAVSLADSAAIPLQISAFYFQKQFVREMAEFAAQSSTRFPKEARLPFMAGFGYSQIDSSRRAVEELNKAVSIDDKYVDAWAQLGILYNSAGQTALSDSAYERVLQLDPDNALVNNNYAYSFSERNINLERAEQMTLTALKAEPKNPSYLDTMGWIYFQQAKYDKARDYILQAIENGEVSAAVYEHLGDAYEKLGELNKAVEAWNKALRKDPNRSSSKERLAKVKAK